MINYLSYIIFIDFIKNQNKVYLNNNYPPQYFNYFQVSIRSLEYSNKM